MVIYNINGNYPAKGEESPVGLSSPNAYFLKNSKYLKKEERDIELVYSPSREGYIIPITRFDLLHKYHPRYEVEEVFDSILEKPKEIQKFSSIKSFKQDQNLNTFYKIQDRCKSLGITFKDVKTHEDPSLTILKREYDHSLEEIKQLDRDIVHYSQSKEWKDPKPLPRSNTEVQPFKENMLPEALKGWILDIADRMQIPPDFSAASCIVALGSLIGRKIGVYPKQKDDWLVIPNLWGMIVGRPSLLKSPAMAEVMKPIDILINRAGQKYKDDLSVYERGKELFEAQKTALKDRLKCASTKQDKLLLDKVTGEQNDLPILSKPILKRYKTEDATVEKIGKILQENPQGILVHRDELSGWLKSLDKYGREGDRAFYLEAWNGSGSFTVDRIGRGTVHIPALCLSVLGGIQPGPLSAYVAQATKGGFEDDEFCRDFKFLFGLIYLSTGKI